MGNIANKRGGHGGRNAPPQVYMGFGEIEDGPDANPLGAVADIIKFLVYACMLGVVLWLWKLMKGER